MVDELTQQSWQTGKAVWEISVDIVKALAKGILWASDKLFGEDQENIKLSDKLQSFIAEHNANKGMPSTLGEWASETNIDTMDISDQEVADLLEQTFKDQNIKYMRMDDSSFYIEADSRNVVDGLVKGVAKQIASEREETQMEIADGLEEKLQKAGIEYERNGNHIQAKKEKDKPTVEKYREDTKKIVKQTRQEKKERKNEKVKDKIKRNQQKAAKKDKNRQRQKQKDKKQDKGAR